MLIPFLALGFKCMAQGDLLLTPIRVVFDGNKQREEINLANIGKDTATYSISFVNYKMKEDGSYAIIEKPDSGQMFAEPYLRIFPRKVTLLPGESQVIMLQCRRNSNMVAGEYRSHLYFRSEKNYKPLRTKNADTTTLTVQLIPVFGISIPIIIRSGVTNVSAAITGLKLEFQQDTIPYLKLTINRTGNISIYGDIIIEYTPPQGKPYQIGKVKNAGVFTNISRRFFSIQLTRTPGMNLRNGKLKVRYTSPDEVKYEEYAESVLELANDK